MVPLSPKCALKFAEQAYDIEFGIDTFLPSSRLNKYFKFNNNAMTLEAKTGSSHRQSKQRISNFVLVAEGKEKNKYGGSLVLSFRGTNFSYAADVMTDANIALKGSPNGALAHAGFVSTFNSMKNELASYMSRSIGRISVIHCVGHSLGGAVASVCADWLRANYKIHVYLYTFGAPRVGLKNYATKSSHTNLKIFRCTNGADPVPMVPLWPFTHAPIDKPEFRLDSSSGVQADAHKLNSSIGYTANLRSDSWGHINRVSIANLNRPVRMHFHNRNQVTFTQRWSDQIASGIITLLKDAGYGALVTAQGIISGGLTFYDLLARVMVKISKASSKLADQTRGLLGHMLVFAGKVVKEITTLSYDFIRWVFKVTLDRLYRAVRNAINPL